MLNKRFLYGPRLLLVLSLLCIRLPGLPAPHGLTQTDAITRFSYDANGNVASRTAADGAVTTYRHDASDRLVEIHYADGTWVTFEYDALGQRTRMIDTLGETRYTYDIHGRVTQVTDPHGQTIAYAYDPRGLMTALTYPDGYRATYTWDKNGQLVAVEDRAGATRYQYDDAGKLLQRTLPNGVASRYGYDQASRLASIRHTGRDGAPLLEMTYGYDAGGSRSEMTRSISGGAPEVTRYAYDDLVRLTQVTYPDGETVKYTYGPTGNRLAKTSSKAGETRYTYDGLGRLTAIQGPGGDETLAYDANGNLVRRSGNGQDTTYVWDGENRLIGVRGRSTQVVFRYDGDGRRLEKVVDGKVTQYVQHGNVIPQVLLATSGGQALRSLPGQPRSGEAGPAGTRYYLEDGLGSVVGAVDTNGALVGTVEYDAFGALRRPNALLAEFGYTGEQADKETGLVFLRARYYDPESGRFISSDVYPPYVFDPVSLNPYTYAKNDPANLIDPLGLQSGPPPPPPFLWQHSRWYFWIPVPSIGIPTQVKTSPPLDRDSVLIRTRPLEMKLGPLLFQKFGIGHTDIIIGGRPYGFFDNSRWESRPNPFPGVETYYTTNWDSTITAQAIARHAGNPSTYNFLRESCQNAVCQIGHEVGGSMEGLWLPGDILNHVVNTLFPASSDMEGGEEAVGGIIFDKAAEVLIDLTDIIGATYDPMLGQLILIGSQDASLPPMDKDDLAIAIRAVLSGEDPGMTMVPVDPSMTNITQRVEYFGQTENTRFGKVMFEADRYLKSLTAGTDTLTGQPVDVSVPGFKSELALSVELCTDVPWHRNWFVPDKIVLKQSSDGRSMTFNEATIKLESRFITFNNGEVQDIPGDSPVTTAFTRFVTDHYAEFAVEKAELAELVRLAKIVGVVKWLYDTGIPVDLSWMKDYRIAQVETPTTTPGIKATASDPNCAHEITSAGGVGMNTPNTVVPEDNGEATALASQVLAARPPNLPIAWPVEHNGETLTAVAMSLAPTPIVGGYTDSWIDAAVPLVGGQTAAIVRLYNSVDMHASVLGPGWSLVLPALAFSRTPVPDQPGHFTTAAELVIGPTRLAFQGVSSDGLYLPRDLTGEYSALGLLHPGDTSVRAFPPGFTAAPAIPGQPIEIRNEQNEPLAFDRFALMAKDGRVLLFDSLGRYVGLRDAAGNQVDVRYDGERLTEIRDAGQRGIRLEYDAGGKLVQLTGSDGSSVRYNYDANGNLVKVSDEAGTRAEYRYDAANRLAAVLDEAGRRVQENVYDSLGRVVSARTGDLAEPMHISYDTQANTARYAPGSDAPSHLQYDEQKRLTDRTDPLGNKQLFRYDQDGRLVGETDPKGQTTTYLYDSNGFLTEVVSPSGERTHWLGYGPLGVPQASIDAVDQLTFFDYDERGRVKSIASGYQLGELSADGSISYTKVAPQVIAFTYDQVGNLTAVQDQAGATTSYSYDALGNLTQTILPEGGTISRAYDERSRLKTIQDPAGFFIDFDYDPRGQMTQIASPAGAIEYAYTDGRLVAVTDPVGRTTQFGYDAQGRLATVTEASGTQTHYEYDATSNLSAVADARGERFEFQYDPMGHLIVRIQRGQASTESATSISMPVVSISDVVSSAAQDRSAVNPLATSSPSLVGSSNLAPTRFLLVIGLLILSAGVACVVLLLRPNRQKRKRARTRYRA